MKVEKANKNDAEPITELTIRSKDYWNYGAKQIEEWREELTIRPKYIEENQVYKLLHDNRIAGFYAYQATSPKVVKLNFLFIEPAFIGQGCGKILMHHFLERIKKTDFEKITLDADPNAEQFYRKIGFKVVGQLKTAIKDRFLPIMEMTIKPELTKQSEIPLNFETDDFSTKDFLDFIEAPKGQKINYFSVLMSKKEAETEPLIFWLNTGAQKWHRFFIDAWLTHWDEYNEIEKEALIEEDFEAYDAYFVRDLMDELSLKDKKIKEIEVSRFFEHQLFTAQIKISIEGNLWIIVRDYGEEKPSELLLSSDQET